MIHKVLQEVAVLFTLILTTLFVITFCYVGMPFKGGFQ